MIGRSGGKEKDIQLGKLNGEGPGCGARTVDEKVRLFFCRLCRVREAQRLVKRLANGGNAHSKSSCLFVGDRVRNLHGYMSFSRDMLCKGAIFVVEYISLVILLATARRPFHMHESESSITAMSEASHSVSDLQAIGDSCSHLFDDSSIVTAGDAALV